MTDPAADLAHPVLPWPITSFNRVARPFARRLFPLDILVRALEAEAHLTPFGRLVVGRQLADLLATRLRVQELVTRRPEIVAAPVTAPIVIAGLPRTGTTLLHRLLAADPGLRSLPYWEALAPLPRGDAAIRSADPGPRVRRAAQGLRLLHWAAPRMLAMHEMTAEGADEEIWLLAVDFATMLFEASWRVPAFRDWYDRADLRPGYAWLRRMLQVLQWYRPAERWVLKSPQHLGQLGPLLATFPDATIVQTHRDPVAVVASMAHMVAYGRRMVCARIDPIEIGAYWADRVAWLLRRSTEDRPPGGRFTDVQFRELMDDPLGVVRRIYAVAGRDLAPAAEAAMRAWLAANPRGKHGGHRYRPEDTGLDVAALRARLRAYQTRFGVPDE